MKNITEKAGTYTVQTADGKTRVFKTRKGAENHAAKHAVTVQVPRIVKANTYFWSPSGNASGRRSNEERHEAEINVFASKFDAVPTIRVAGMYQETCKNVYKTMDYSVMRKGEWKSTNYTGLVGEAARWGITLVE